MPFVRLSDYRAVAGNHRSWPALIGIWVLGWFAGVLVLAILTMIPGISMSLPAVWIAAIPLGVVFVVIEGAYYVAGKRYQEQLRQRDGGV